MNGKVHWGGGFCELCRGDLQLNVFPRSYNCNSTWWRPYTNGRNMLQKINWCIVFKVLCSSW